MLELSSGIITSAVVFSNVTEMLVSTVNRGSNQIFDQGFKSTNIQHHLVSILKIIVLLKLHQVAQHSLALLNVNHLKGCFPLSDVFFVFRLFYS